MIDIAKLAPVGAILIICFLPGLIVKRTPLDNKWIPVINGIDGGFLGFIGRTTIPEFPYADPITAIAIGIFSGLSAVGAHQLLKQLLGTKEDGESE